MTIWAVALALCAGASTLWADEGASGRLDAAKELFELVEYEKAAEAFLAIAEDPEATDAQRREAWHLRAVCLAGLDQMDDARDAFVAVLDLDPDFELPAMVSPKVREAHEAALAFVAARPPVAEPPPVEPPVRDPPARPRAQPPSLRTWSMVAAGGGVATLTAGGIVGGNVRAGVRRYQEEPESFASQSEAHAFAQTLESRARTANLLFVGGAVLTAGAVTLFLVDEGAGDRATSDYRLGVQTWPGGGALTAEIRW